MEHRPFATPLPPASNMNAAIVLPITAAGDVPFSDSAQIAGADAIIGLASEIGKADLPREAPRSIADPRIPRQIAEQLVAVVKQGPGGPVEVTLNPEELGRVRMTLNSSEGSIAVALTIERPETADLMRRNLGALSTEFRQLGYSDVSFDFSGSGAGRGGFQDRKITSGRAHEGAAGDDAEPHSSPAPRIAKTAALDLRI